MMWGGRFSKGLDNQALSFSRSLPVDINLLTEDITVGIAHVTMLAQQNLIDDSEKQMLITALSDMLQQYEQGTWNPQLEDFEDIHSAVEGKLNELIGELSGKLHTGRSRNDLVSTDIRLWLKNHIPEIISVLCQLQNTLLAKAAEHTATLMPGYTHTQRAQPISLAFHLLAYVSMLERDKQHFQFALAQADSSPLGCGALAGSTLPLDRHSTAKALGFSQLCANALDAVSDRDFIMDMLHACSLGMMHLSRLCEELILWSGSEWHFVTLADSWTTGSSLMPQKKNPDMAELVRGKTGRVYGNEISLKTSMKALPLSYNRDMQEDKEPLFDSFNTYLQSLNVCIGMIDTALFNKERFTAELNGDFSFATDIADWLVLQGIPFRKAHHLTGQLIRYAECNDKKLHQLTLEEFQDIDCAFTAEILTICTIDSALTRKKTAGSPNPDLVDAEIARWNAILQS